MREDSEENPITLNLTNSSLFDNEQCQKQRGYQFAVATLDLLSLLLGQPMSVRLLWITLTAKQPDILNSNLALFHYVLYGLLYHHLIVLFLFPQALTRSHKLIFVYVQVGGPMQLCFICLERFIAVIHPTNFPLIKKYKCREVCASLVWILSLPLIVVYLLPDGQTESVENILQHVPAFLMLVLSSVMAYTSYKVARALRNSPVGKDSIHPAKRRAFITICVTSVTAMSCYFPVVVMRYSSINETIFDCKLIPVCIFLLSVASLVHPLFYLATKGEFNCKRWGKKPN